MNIHSTSKILLSVLISLFCIVSVFAESSFYDVPLDPVYSPHINELFENNLITGYTNLNGESTGEYGSNHTIERSAFAKISAIVRLAEIYGNQESWQNMDKDELTLTLEDKLKYYHRCINDIPNCSTENGADIPDVCNVCSDGIPFPDVKEDPVDCQSEGMCSWYAKYVYYLTRKGTVQGYTNYDPPLYKPSENIKRIHALKMIIVDDGNISPENDPRYIRLSSLANSNNSYTPKCLKGAESFIRDNNGASDPEEKKDAEKLLKYAILADRLDLFGNNCQVITNAGLNKDNPLEVAYFLQRPVLRKEIPRYLSITTSYVPIEPDPVTDTTINTPEENANSETIADEPYEIPVFVDPTPDGDEDTYNLFTEESSTEVILEGNTRIIIDTETGNYVVQDIATGTILETGTVEEGTTAEELIENPAVIENNNLTAEEREEAYGEAGINIVQETENEEVSDDHQIQEEINQMFEDSYYDEEYEYIDPSDPTTKGYITANSNIECGDIIIDAGERFQTLWVEKVVTRSGTKYYQNIAYGNYPSCRVSCDTLPTPECRTEIAKDKGIETETVAGLINFGRCNDENRKNVIYNFWDEAVKTEEWATPEYICSLDIDLGNRCDNQYTSKWCDDIWDERVKQMNDWMQAHIDGGNTAIDACVLASGGKENKPKEYKVVIDWCDKHGVTENDIKYEIDRRENFKIDDIYYADGMDLVYRSNFGGSIEGDLPSGYYIEKEIKKSFQITKESSFDSKKSYQNRNTYIITHGWNSPYGKANGDDRWDIWTKQMADKILIKDGSAQILLLNWSEIAHTATPGKAAKWIGSITDVTADALKQWGANKNRTTVIGFSLGGLLTKELSDKLGGINIIALDPAASIGDYKIDFNGNTITTFNNKGACIVADASWSGSETLMKTCREKYLIDYSGNPDFTLFTELYEYVDFVIEEAIADGLEYVVDKGVTYGVEKVINKKIEGRLRGVRMYKIMNGKLVEVFIKNVEEKACSVVNGTVKFLPYICEYGLKEIKERFVTYHTNVHKVYDTILSNPLRGDLLLPQNIASRQNNFAVLDKEAHGIIYTERDNPYHIKYLKVQTHQSPNRYTLYGNTQVNNFECNPGKDCEMYGGGGEDKFYHKIQPNALYLKDFKENENDSDKIYLPSGYENITASQNIHGGINITATYETRNNTTKYVNVILENTSWSLWKVREWVRTAKDPATYPPDEGTENPIIIK